jgi:hypothetical protein
MFFARPVTAPAAMTSSQTTTADGFIRAGLEQLENAKESKKISNMIFACKDAAGIVINQARNSLRSV